MVLELSGTTIEFVQDVNSIEDEDCKSVMQKIIAVTGRTDAILITKVFAEKGIDKGVAIQEFCQKFAEYVVVWVTGAKFSGNAIHSMIDREVAEQAAFMCLDYVFDEDDDTHFYLYSQGAGMDALTAMAGYYTGAMIQDVFLNETARKALLKEMTAIRPDILNKMKEIISEAIGLTKADSF